MKLLIAYDGSESADSALSDLARAGLPATVEAFITVVAEVWLPPPPPSSLEVIEAATGAQPANYLAEMCGPDSPLIREADQSAEQAAGRLRQIFPQWNIENKIRCGSPAGELITEADEYKPDLIVVGSHGRTVLGRAFIGSVSQKLAAAAQSSVRVGRGRNEPPPAAPLKLVLGFDGSAGSELAVRELTQRRWPAETEVRIVTSTAPFRDYWPSTRVQLKYLEAVQQTAANKLTEAGLSVSSKIGDHEPKRLLVSEAESWGTDCIFVGATGHTFLDRILFGSVAAAVVARAHCSVEVVRRRNA